MGVPRAGSPCPTGFGIFDGEVTFQADSPWVNEGPRPNPSDGSETFYLSSPDERMILDVEGTRLMIAAGRSPDSPQQDLEELRTILDSIQFKP